MAVRHVQQNIEALTPEVSASKNCWALPASMEHADSTVFLHSGFKSPHVGGFWHRILLLWQSSKRSLTLLGCSNHPRTPTRAPSPMATSASCTGWTAALR